MAGDTNFSLFHIGSPKRIAEHSNSVARQLQSQLQQTSEVKITITKVAVLEERLSQQEKRLSRLSSRLNWLVGTITTIFIGLVGWALKSILQSI